MSIWKSPSTDMTTDPSFARVTKIIMEKDGLPIGTTSENPILDTRMYEVECADRYKTAMA